MLADMQKGPFAPLVRLFGLEEWSWATQAWSARLMVLVGDTWQWTPFMFIVLLAAIENQPRDQVEAAQLDGAAAADLPRHHLAAIARSPRRGADPLIEAFKISTCPNVLTGGGPGCDRIDDAALLHISWRTQDLGSSAAGRLHAALSSRPSVCVSFFNFVVRRRAQFDRARAARRSARFSSRDALDGRRSAKVAT
jgi:multiple sugar transport system permease protein